MDMWIVWAIVAMFMLVVEFVTPGFFAIVVTVGALSALLISLMIKNLFVQIIVFLIVSVLSYIYLKPVIRKFFQPKTPITTTSARLVGSHGVVIKKIEFPDFRGLVKVEGETWTAKTDNYEIKEGTTVRVAAIEGASLIVVEDIDSQYDVDVQI